VGGGLLGEERAPASARAASFRAGGRRYPGQLVPPKVRGGTKVPHMWDAVGTFHSYRSNQIIELASLSSVACNLLRAAAHNPERLPMRRPSLKRGSPCPRSSVLASRSPSRCR
jgi:hypothetical protein